MTPIVQEDYVAAMNLVSDLALDFGGGWGSPVISGYVPHDWFKPKFAGDAEHGGTTPAEWGTKKIGMLPDCVLQNRAAMLKFLANFSLALKSQ